MYLVVLDTVGTILQGAFLAAFVLISRTDISAIGKPCVLAAFFMSMTLLLWQAVRLMREMLTLFAFSILISFGDPVTFCVVDTIFFRAYCFGLRFL